MIYSSDMTAKGRLKKFFFQAERGHTFPLGRSLHDPQLQAVQTHSHFFAPIQRSGADWLGPPVRSRNELRATLPGEELELQAGPCGILGPRKGLWEGWTSHSVRFAAQLETTCLP